MTSFIPRMILSYFRWYVFISRVKCHRELYIIVCVTSWIGSLCQNWGNSPSSVTLWCFLYGGRLLHVSISNVLSLINIACYGEQFTIIHSKGHSRSKKYPEILSQGVERQFPPWEPSNCTESQRDCGVNVASITCWFRKLISAALSGPYICSWYFSRKINNVILLYFNASLILFLKKDTVVYCYASVKLKIEFVAFFYNWKLDFCWI